MRLWLGRYVDKVDESVVPWLVGRARWSTLVLRRMYESWCTMQEAFAQMCEKQFQDTDTGEKDGERGLLRLLKSLFDCEIPGDSSFELRNRLVENALKWMFFGEVTKYREERNVVIECGLGCFDDKNEVATVDEPLVISALFLHEVFKLQKEDKSQSLGVEGVFKALATKYLAGQDLVTSAMEWCAVLLMYPRLQEVMKDTGFQASQVFPIAVEYEKDVFKWFKKWLFREDAKGLAINKSNKDDKKPGLSEWLQWKINGRKCALFYYPVNQCGPDLIFSLVKKGEVVAFVFVQVKTGSDKNKEAIMNTVNPDQLYHSRKKNKVSSGKKEEFKAIQEVLKGIPVIRMWWVKQAEPGKVASIDASLEGVQR